MTQVILCWCHGGKNVQVAGTFNNWHPQPLHKQGNKFFLILNLEDGYYNYKYVVDGRWVYDLSEPNADDGSGNWNNFLEIGGHHHVPARGAAPTHAPPKKEQQPKKEQPKKEQPKKEQPKKEQPKKQEEEEHHEEASGDKPLSKNQQKKLAKQQQKQQKKAAQNAAEHEAPVEEAAVVPEAKVEAEVKKEEKKAESIATLEIVQGDVDVDMGRLEEFVRSHQFEGLKWEGSSVHEHFFGLKKLEIICRCRDDFGLEDLCRKMEENEELVGSANIKDFSC